MAGRVVVVVGGRWRGGGVGGYSDLVQVQLSRVEECWGSLMGWGWWGEGEGVYQLYRYDAI